MQSSSDGSVPRQNAIWTLHVDRGRDTRDSASCRRLRNIVSGFIRRFYTTLCFSSFPFLFSDFPSFAMRNYAFELIFRLREWVHFVSFRSTSIHVYSPVIIRVYDKNSMRYHVIDEIITWQERCHFSTFQPALLPRDIDLTCIQDGIMWRRTRVRVVQERFKVRF